MLKDPQHYGISEETGMLVINSDVCMYMYVCMYVWRGLSVHVDCMYVTVILYVCILTMTIIMR